MTTPIQPIPVEHVPRIALRREEAAEALGVSDRTLWTWTKAGDVPHVRIGGVVMYPVDGLRDWLASRQNGNECSASCSAAANNCNDPPQNGEVFDSE